MEKCNVCGEYYDPAFLSQVAEHMHEDVEIDKEYYGKKVNETDDDKWLRKKLGGEIMNIRIQNREDGIWFVFDVAAVTAYVNMSERVPETEKAAFALWFERLWHENGLTSQDGNEEFYLKRVANDKPQTR